MSLESGSISNLVVVELPNINRRIKATLKASFGPTGNLGCHTSYITGFTLEPQFHMDGGFAVLDETKDKIKRVVGGWEDGGIAQCEYNAVITQLGAGSVEIKEAINENMYQPVVAAVQKVGNPVIFLSDTYNKFAKCKPDPYNRMGYSVATSKADRKDFNQDFFPCVTNFVRWLVENRIGHVTCSPVVHNPRHETSKDFSMNQAWIWIPPNKLDHIYPGSARRHGDGLVPTEEAFYKRWGPALGVPSTASDLKDRVDGILWHNGKFEHFKPNKIIKQPSPVQVGPDREVA